MFLKVDGANPTGSFKDRGMTMAVTDALARGQQGVICASTGNTSASAAAYAARAGMTCAVLVPRGKIALGKLAQAVAHERRRVVHGQHDHGGVGARPPDPFDHRLGTGPRHLDVEQQDVRPVPLDQRDGLVPVGGLAGHVELRIRGQQLAQPLPEQGVVVGDDDGDLRFARPGHR